MNEKFLVLNLEHKDEVTVEEFFRRQSIEYIGWVARKSDGMVEKEVVKRFGEYFIISDYSTRKSVIGKGLRKKAGWQTTCRLTMDEEFHTEDCHLLKSCPIVVAVVDLDCDKFIDHFQRYCRRYAFSWSEVKKAKERAEKEVDVDVFVNDKYIERNKFIALAG